MNDEPYRPGDRRPIASRDTGWARRIARGLSSRQVSPNAISMASVGFATLGALAILATQRVGVPERFLWLAAAICVPLRLLCNLFDGMVAMESDLASPLGELFNEVPDRLSDVVLLAALGLVPGSSPHLGYGAAILALFVAYLRAMGAVAGAGQVFAGVMAKQRRMMVVTVVCLFQALAPVPWRDGWEILGQRAPGLGLAIVGLGCLITAFTRGRTIAIRLRSRP